MSLHLYNTLTRKKEEFVPIEPKKVRLYTCGPTVYHFAHIGNLRTYVFEDLLRRTLSRAGFEVNHVMNITDVGHLESDADDGEDKMEIAQRREQKSPWEIARFYEDAFLEDCRRLEILKPHIVCRATEHIPEMIAMVKTLQEKGFAYVAGGNTPNVYFDTAKFPSYKSFARLVDDPNAVARVDEDSAKKNREDFVLWFTLDGSKFKNQIMKWDSPWGVGFPGWHIECSAMASKYLGDTIDIHCGGIDHIPVHHTNEIAQSECCHGHQWVNYWLHGAFLLEDSGKMSKSKGDFLTLKRVMDEGFSPLHYRYLCLTAHYRGELRFSFDSLSQAKAAYDTLCHKADAWRATGGQAPVSPAGKTYIQRIDASMQDDINAPVALAVLWEAMRDDKLSPADQLGILDAADSALGLGGVTLDRPQLDADQLKMVAEREVFRRAKNWAESDRLRDLLAAQGILLKDRPEGTTWYKDKKGAQSA